MIAQIKATGKIVKVGYVARNLYGSLDSTSKLYTGDDLDFNIDPPHPEATISKWVARTKKGELIFSDKPPVGKSNVIWHYREGTDVRLLSELELFGNDIFPSLTWDDDPIEVEITIKPK